MPCKLNNQTPHERINENFLESFSAIEKTSIEVTRETAEVSNVLGKRGPG